MTEPRKPQPPAVKVRIGKATITIPLEAVSAAAANPQAAQLLARLINRKP